MSRERGAKSDGDTGVFHRLLQSVTPELLRAHYSRKFFVAFFFVVVAIGAVGGANFFLIQETVSDQARDDLRSQANSRALLQSQWVNEMESQSQLISGTVSPNTLSLRDTRERSSSDVVAIHYVDANEREVAASTEQEMSGLALDAIEAPWARTFERVDLLRSPPATVWVTNQSYERDTQPVVAFVSPTPANRSATVLVSSNERLARQFGSSSTVTTTIYTGAGRRLFGERSATGSLDTGVLDRVSGTNQSSLASHGDQLVVYAPIEGTDWVAVTRARKSEMDQASDAVGSNVLYIITTSILLLIGIGIALGRHTIAPLNRLRRGTQRLAERDFDVDLSTSRSDEIGQLYDDFETMRDALQRQMRETIEAKEEVEAQRDNLQRVTTRLQLALDETETGVWEWNARTEEMVWDEASEHLYGFDAGDFPGTFEAFADRILDEDLEQVHREIETAIETSEEYRIDFRIRLPNGEERWIQARGVVRHDDGEPERLIGIQTDVTEQKESEQALKQARKELRQVIDLVPDPLYAKDRDDEVLLSNEANANLHGMTKEEIEGVREREIESDVENIKNFDKYRQREREVMDTGESTTFEEVLTDPDGNKHVFKTSRIPFGTTESGEDAVLGYARDVTDLKEYEQELEETKRTLEQSNEKLDQFAGIVSHDLQNPLNAAQLRLDLLRREKTDERIDEVEESLDRMQSMIEELLTLSRAGETVDDPQQVSLVAVATESWETAQTDDADFEVSVDESTTIEADRDRLRHVFENLFRNAVDHNDSPLTVRVGLLDDSDETTDDSQRDGFFIEDDGDGISEDEYDDIFSHGYTTNDDGTGFGLSIVEDIVEAHGWTISIAESDEGGARFEITGAEVSDRPSDSWY
jgi:PAS domain S-box-containing protein